MSEDRGIGVLGATGFTGKLVLRALCQLGVRPLAAGRNPAKLEALAAELGGIDTFIADVRQPQSLGELPRRCRVLVNCAGPFVDLGEPVVEAAMENHCHYLDTTGEQPFVRRVQEWHEQARESGVAVVPAHAFEIALADCGAALLAEGYREVASIEVTYATQFHASQGTKRTVLRMLGSEGFVYQDNRWLREPPGRVRRPVQLPPPWGRRTAVSFPGAEVATIPRHTRARNVRVFLALPPALAAGLALALPVIRVLAASPFAALAQALLGSGTEGPEEAVRAKDSFLIHIAIRGVRDGRARHERAVITGRDPYGITAMLAAKAAIRMYEPTWSEAGVLAPAQAFPPREVLDAVAEFDVQWKRLE